MCIKNINNFTQTVSRQFCFNDGKLLACFFGSQQTGDRSKRGIVKVFFPPSYLGYILNVYFARKKYTSDIKTPLRKKTSRPRIELIMRLDDSAVGILNSIEEWFVSEKHPMVKAIIKSH